VSQSLQRVVVRMLVDPAFAKRVHSGEPLAELSPAERELLDAVDPRAFRTDRYRRSRLLQACIEEHLVAVAVLTDGGRALDRADAFFGDPALHRCVQERDVLTLAFGRWLEGQVGPLARLDLAVAHARRRPLPRGTGLTLAGGCWPLAMPTATLAYWQQVRGALGPEPLAGLVGGTASLPPAPAASGDTSWCLVRVDHAGVASLDGSAEGLDPLLRYALDPRPRAELVARFESAGAGAELLDDLVNDGLIVEARPV